MTNPSRRQVTEKELNSIEKMLAANMSTIDVASIMGFSERTVRAIRDGQHVLQLRAKTSPSKDEPLAVDTHNDLLMIYSALCDIRDGVNELLGNKEVTR